MLIKLLRNPASQFGCNLTEGQTGNVGESLGQQLVGLGVAVEITGVTDVDIQRRVITALPVGFEPVQAKAKTKRNKS